MHGGGGGGGGDELCNKDGTVCRRYWLTAIKLTHTKPS